jgi:hypothetical protein
LTMVVTPTNHTTRAMFGGLEAEPPSQSMSLDEQSEQSSIDYSQLIESSTHTRSLLGGTSVADANNNHPLRRGADASVLEFVLEETSTNAEDSSRHKAKDRSSSAAPDPTIFDDLQSQGPPIATPNPMKRIASTGTTKESTMHTTKSGVTMVSRTLHTSNVDVKKTYQQMEEEETDRVAAWAIHVVLGIFCGLILVSVLLTFFVIRKYGMVAMFGLLMLACFAIFLIWYVDSLILSQDARFKPMRNKIVRAVEVAKQVCVDEFNLFKRDWHEHFLLTNGPCVDEEGGDDMEALPDATYQRPPTNKRRSVVFRLIKPVFRLPRKIFRGRKGRSKKGKSKAQEMTYDPPAAENGVIA